MHKVHGILEVPEATDCSGITSVNKKSRQVNPVEGKELEMKEKEDLEEKAKPLGEVEVEERSMGCEERTEKRRRQKWWQDSSAAMPQAIFEKKFAFRLCLRANLKKYLPSGYASGYASGKISVKSKIFQIFKKIAAGYAPGYASGYASGNFKKIFTLRLCPRLFLKKICLQAMPQGKFKKIFALWLCFRLRLRQNFRKIENFPDFQKDSRRLRPRLRFRLRFRQFLKNIHPQAMPQAIFEKNLPSGYASGQI
ncbi:hypothetical protein T03_15748 [Trichinella britovi]|uniref:Uncharacterized protein n=1 Tax=Trichinella britovi TaxID=45882 RepID=A0A0V1D7K7_TRIBR|nr:hypothetical protein T03_15748 [Trichinella britovi]